MEMLMKIRKYEIKVYLENLRRSGKVNMFGAAPYLAKEFGLSTEQAISELTEWMQDYEPTDYRVCKVCGKAMSTGFCIGDGYEYYCSESCLHEIYTEEEYQDLYETDNGYYTEWEE